MFIGKERCSPSTCTCFDLPYKECRNVIVRLSRGFSLKRGTCLAAIVSWILRKNLVHFLYNYSVILTAIVIKVVFRVIVDIQTFRKYFRLRHLLDLTTQIL